MAAKRRKKATGGRKNARGAARKRGGPGRKRPSPPRSPAVATASHGAGPAGELIDMAEAIKLLKTTRPTFYRWLRSGKIKGMKLGRQWRFYREDIERFLKGEEPRVDLPADITPLIEALRKQVEAFGARDLSPEDASDVERAVSLMIVLGAGMRASDIHISAHLAAGSAESAAMVRCRVDGVLHRVASFDIRLLPAVVEQWKRMAAVDVHEKVLPQDGRVLIKPSQAIGTRGDDLLDLRVNFLPAVLGESVTARILDRSTVALKLERIDYAPKDREKLLRAIHSPWGVVLLTGPTGSGKTTVLYACINELDAEKLKIVTVEDPVEYFLEGAVQVSLREKEGMTFQRAVRAMLRSDPDVLLVGEVRNRETLYAVVQSALTGHLVMTTLHANDAAGGLVRMVDIGVDPFVVAEATSLVMSQRLVRLLCRHCSVEDKPDAHRLDLAAELARKGGLEWHSLEPTWRKAVGCEKCGHTGYRGRTVIAEMLEVTPEIGKALRAGASLDELRRIAVSQGMTTMATDGIRRAARGETTLDEVMRVVG